VVPTAVAPYQQADDHDRREDQVAYRHKEDRP
jgi:hypothetical protein